MIFFSQVSSQRVGVIDNYPSLNQDAFCVDVSLAISAFVGSDDGGLVGTCATATVVSFSLAVTVVSSMEFVSSEGLSRITSNGFKKLLSIPIACRKLKPLATANIAENIRRLNCFNLIMKLKFPNYPESSTNPPLWYL